MNMGLVDVGIRFVASRHSSKGWSRRSTTGDARGGREEPSTEETVPVPDIEHVWREEIDVARARSPKSRRFRPTVKSHNELYVD